MARTNVAQNAFPGNLRAQTAAINYLNCLSGIHSSLFELLVVSWQVSSYTDAVNGVARIERSIKAIEWLGHFGAKPFKFWLAGLLSRAVDLRQQAWTFTHQLARQAQTANLNEFNHAQLVAQLDHVIPMVQRQSHDFVQPHPYANHLAELQKARWTAMFHARALATGGIPKYVIFSHVSRHY